MAFAGAIVAVAVVAAAAVSAVAQIQAGEAAKDAADFNADVLDQNADATPDQTEAEEKRRRRLNALILSRQVTATGAAGLLFDGTPLDLFEDSAIEGSIDALNIRREGTIQENNLRAQASLERFSGRNARRQARFGAASTLLMGLGSAAGGFAGGASGAGTSAALTSSGGRLRQSPSGNRVGFAQGRFGSGV